MIFLKNTSILYCFENQCSPREWKKANIVPVDKKNRPVSLLPIWGKIFEKIIFNSLFKYLEKITIF